MKYITWLAGGSGIVAFLVGIFMRVAKMEPVLGASPSGWWRASIGLVAIGSFFALTEILNALKKEVSQ